MGKVELYKSKYSGKKVDELLEKVDSRETEKPPEFYINDNGHLIAVYGKEDV